MAALASLHARMGVSVGAQASTPVSATPRTGDAPESIIFPRDDGPHPVSIEWWYFTGHLFTEPGDRYGFEFVVFKGRRGELTGYASHFAITDNASGTFHYDQRLGLAPPDANELRETGFDLQATEWRMTGVGGVDRLSASMDGYAIEVTTAPRKPPAIHDGDGYVDYGDLGASYYYSRTRLAVEGVLTVDGLAMPVTGESWFDHQWGEFTTATDAGWDWYALQLDNGWDLMLYVIHDPDGTPRVVDGSWIDPEGGLTVLEAADFTVAAMGSWTSPRTGTTYPSGWEITLPSADLAIAVRPSMPDQELDTTLSTGVTYWEGEVLVEGTFAGAKIGGLGYVELTGYAPVLEISGTPAA